MKVAVLGGGITGVTASHLLAERGHDVHCLEAANRVGGLCASETVDGFVADRAGGHIIFSRDQQVLDFVLQALGDGGYHTCERQTWIVHDGRHVQYPFENGLADLDKAETAMCLEGYIQAWHERKSGAPEPQNFHDWCLWRFGEGICETFMHPYNRKIWNVDLREMGIQWVSGRVPDAPMEDVVRSAIGVRTEGYKHQSVFHYPLEGGFETIVHAVANKLPNGALRLSTPAETVVKKDGGWDVNGEHFDRVISTLPLQQLLPTLSEDMPGDVREAFDALDYTSLMTVFLALDKPEVPPHSWLYFPHAHQGPQNRITYLSNYSPKNAPEGCTSIMAEVTYYGDAPGTDEEVTNQVVEGLSGCGLMSKDELRFAKVWHNEYAYILYRQGLEGNLDKVRGWCKDTGLDIAGRFGNYNYYNSDMCIRAAMDLVADRY